MTNFSDLGIKDDEPKCITHYYYYYLNGVGNAGDVSLAALPRFEGTKSFLERIENILTRVFNPVKGKSFYTHISMLVS